MEHLDLGIKCDEDFTLQSVDNKMLNNIIDNMCLHIISKLIITLNLLIIFGIMK